MTTILLTRHGHVGGINPPRFRGRTNLPLTDQGREQAGKVARRIADTWNPTVVYTSPLARCVDTGAAIAAACGISSQVRSFPISPILTTVNGKEKTARKHAWQTPPCLRHGLGRPTASLFPPANLSKTWPRERPARCSRCGKCRFRKRRPGRPRQRKPRDACSMSRYAALLVLANRSGPLLH
jgi:histidine phosphatase superfamily protein (branch 1)